MTRMVVVVTKNRMDWNLLARAQGALVVARKHLLRGPDEPLDEDAELFLAEHLRDLELPDLLAVMACRGRSNPDLPVGAIPTSTLASRFLELWREEEGFHVRPSGDGYTLWAVDVRRIDPHAWHHIVMSIVPRLPATVDPIVRSDRWFAVRSLDGCAVFNRVADRELSSRAPLEVRGGAACANGDLVEMLEPVRWDPGACVATLVERAQLATRTSDLYPLWVLDHLGLLDDAADPATVLSEAVRLPPDYWSMAEEERVGRPSCLYPIYLALRWPGRGAPQARRWLRALIVAALERTSWAHAVEQLLLGTGGFEADCAWAERDLTPQLTAWLDDADEFDALMRTTVEVGRPLPSAWVTVVRDLTLGREGAWPRALSWVRAVVANAEVSGSQVLDSLLRNAPSRVAPGSGGVAGTGVEGPQGALCWIALGSPLPAVLEDAFEGQLKEVLDAAERLDPRRWGPRGNPWKKYRWIRQAALPMSSERRASLIRTLRDNPSWLSEPELDATVDRIGPLVPEEMPPFEQVPWGWHGGLEEAVTIRDRYLALGGEHAKAEVLRAFDTALDQVPSAPRHVAAWIALAGPLLDADRRRRVSVTLSGWSLSWLCEGTIPGQVSLLEFVDLPSVARAQLRDPPAPFASLPATPELVAVLLERLAWLTAEGDAAWEASLSSATPAAHADDLEYRRDRTLGMVDGEVLALVDRLLGAGVEWERMEDVVRARAASGSSQRCDAILDLLARNGATRRSLVAIVCERLSRLTTRHFLVGMPLLVAVASRMNSRSAWEADGSRLVNALWGVNTDALLEICRIAVARSGDHERVTEAMQMVFARELVGRVREAMERGEQRAAQRGLLALMELDAPSRAIQLVLPLRKVPGQDEEVRTALDACEHLLRRDAGRQPHVSTIAVALAHWFSDSEDPAGCSGAPSTG